MALIDFSEKPPLSVDKDGVVRVGKSHVTLDAVVAAFQMGATAEEIAQQYPSLSRAEVNAVIAYYLRRKQELNAYLVERTESASRLCQENEGKHPPAGIRERLLARLRLGS